MAEIENPALMALLARIQPELVLAQVIIQRINDGFALRHVDDRATAAESLRAITAEETRALAQRTRTGEFRPLKCAPTLPAGWRISARNDAELGTALDRLYPGAVADWFATQTDPPPVTHYREYASRQSGMFRVTAKLNDEQIAGVIRVICAPAACLKKRLWTVPGFAPDSANEKSIVPCLEPCAVLMEAARKTFRESQEKIGDPQSTP